MIPAITTLGRNKERITGVVGTPLAYNITATGTPTSYTCLPIPNGETLDTATGHITGTPTVAQTVKGTATATNADGTSPQAEFGWYISPTGCPYITSALFLTYAEGDFVNYQITAGNSPTSFSNPVGDLPTWLVIDQVTGIISGTVPIGVATKVNNFQIVAANSTGNSRKTDVTIYIGTVVTGDVPVITSADHYDLFTGDTPSFQVTATNSPTGYAMSPAIVGFQINKTLGTITGRLQTTAATYTTTITAKNAAGTSVPQDFTINVTDNGGGGGITPPPILTGSKFTYTEYNAFAEQILPPCPNASGGVPPEPPTNLAITVTLRGGILVGDVTWTPPGG